MLIDLTKEELMVIHDALIYFVETKDYTDRESIIILELYNRLEEIKSKIDSEE